MDIKEVKQRAIILEDQMQTYYQQFGTFAPMSIAKANIPKLTFCCNNDVVLFIDENGVQHVIPDIGVQDILKKEGYLNMRFYVPFSNGDYPVAFENEWKKLKGLWKNYMEAKSKSHC